MMGAKPPPLRRGRVQVEHVDNRKVDNELTVWVKIRPQVSYHRSA